MSIELTSPEESQPLMLERAIEQAAPCVLSAEADGVSLRLTFDSALDADLPEPAQFAISGNAAVESVTAIDSDRLTLQLVAPGLRAEQEATLTYEGTSLRGGGLTIATFDIDVADVTGPPELVSAFAVGAAVFLNFDEPLLERQIPGSRFIPVGPDIDVTSRSVDVGGRSLYLELSDDLPDDLELFGLVYLSGQRGGLSGLTGARVPDAVFVVRNFTETAPAVTTVVADSFEVEMMFNQRVDGGEAMASDFSVTAGRRAIAVKSLDWSPSGVVLTLAERMTSLDAVAVTYTSGEGGPVRDSSGIELAEFQTWAKNVTARPKSLQQRVEDAKLRSSSGETTFERELARGFASDDGIRVSLAGGDGWTTVVRVGLHASIDASPIGESPVRIHVAPIDELSKILEHFASVPSSCWSDETASQTSGWWIGVSDPHGVPTDLGVAVAISGEGFGGFWATFCVLDLISGTWRFARLDDVVVGPALLLRRDIQLRPTEDLWSLVA